MISKILMAVSAIRNALSIFKAARNQVDMNRQYGEASNASKKGDVDKLNDILR